MVPHLDVLRLEAGSLPRAPGVYFWRGDGDRILYIGKAIDLRARVTSYFSNARRDRRTRELISRSRHITYELTGTELEALFRESALIKREQPPYNRALTKPKRLYFLKLDASILDPYLEIVREQGEDDSTYFGPFPSGSIARETMAFLHDVLPLRKCAAAKPRCQPCIYRQMNKCAAPMLGEENRRSHLEAIGRMRDILDGRTDRVAAWLRHKRDRLCESLLFEHAAEIQMRIDALSDHRRQHGILEAAIACRCVLVRDEGRARADGKSDGPRLLLVAHGHVLSVRNLGGAREEDLVAWTRAHEEVVKAARYEQNELDAAAVLERWLRCNRSQVRWVTVPHDVSDNDLLDRCRFIAGDGSADSLQPEPSAVLSVV